MDLLTAVLIGVSAGATYAVLGAVIDATLNRLGRKRAKGPALILVDDEGREKTVAVGSMVWSTEDRSGS